jgi:predicted Zn-dependent peptidase
VAFEELHRRLFAPGHPYHRPPAGEPADLRAVTSGDLEAFVSARFSPREALLVLVGDVSPDAAEACVAEAFAGLPAGAEPPAAGPGPEAAPGERSPSSARVAAPVAEARAYVAWSLSGFGRREWYAAALLMRGLAAGRSSPLARELVERAGLAREVHGHLLNMRDSSTLAFAALQAPGVDPERLEQGLRTAVLGLLERSLSPDDVRRARRKALNDHYCVVQSLDRRVDLAASLAWCLGASERLESEAERYLETGERELADLAARLGRESVHAAVTLVPAREAA